MNLKDKEIKLITSGNPQKETESAFLLKDVELAVVKYENYLKEKIKRIVQHLEKENIQDDVKEDLEFDLISYERNLATFKKIFGDFMKE